jgi:hypothetical protein
MSVAHHDDHVDDLLGRLGGVLGDASELSLLSLDVQQLNRWLLAMTRLVSQAQGLQAAAIQEAEAAGLSVAFGSRVLTTHLAKTTGAPAKVLAYERGVALWLRDFPLFQQALIDGVFYRNHVLELKHLDNPKINGLLQRDQQMLVDSAREFDWVQWKQIVAYWQNAADPPPPGDVSAPRAETPLASKASGMDPQLRVKRS